MRRPRVRLPTGYHEQTYASPYFVIRYPHQLRYRTARDAILRADPRALLDYGAGDGRLLVDLLRAGLGSETIVAYEPVDRFAHMLETALDSANLRHRVEIVRAREDLEGRSFDFVACLGVLEHMPLPERQAFYDLCAAALTHDGRVFVDVPVEVGPTLVVKALGRQVLKGREAEYRLPELLRLALGAKMYDPGRFDPSDTRTWIHHHRGFDYRLLRQELAHRFRVLSEQRTPLPWLPAPLGNQEIYFTLSRS